MSYRLVSIIGHLVLTSNFVFSCHNLLIEICISGEHSAAEIGEHSAGGRNFTITFDFAVENLFFISDATQTYFKNKQSPYR